MRLFRPIIIITFSVLAIGCGKGFETISKDSTSFSDYETPPTTGSETEVTTPDGETDVRPTTTSGSVDLFALLRAERGAANDPDFAKEIERVDVGRLEGTNSLPAEYQISFKLKNLHESIRFEFSRDKGTETTDQEFQAKSDNDPNYNYRLNIKCTSDDCSALFLTLKKFDTDHIKIAETSMLYSREKTSTRLKTSSKNPTATDPKLQSFLDKLKRSGQAEKVTTMVLDGSSITEVQIPDPDAQDSAAADAKPLLRLRTDNVPTNDGPTLIDDAELNSGTDSQSGGTSPDLDSEVIFQGLDPSTGDMAVQLNINDPTNSADPYRMRLYLDKQDSADENSPQTPPTTDPNGSTPPTTQPPSSTGEIIWDKALFPMTYDDALELQETRRVTEGLEHYRNHKEVIRFMNVWKGLEEYKQCSSKSVLYHDNTGTKKGVQFSRWGARLFFQNMKPFAEPLVKLSNMVDAPPQSNYLAAIESSFYRDFNTNIVTPFLDSKGNPSNSDASGIFQMLTDTAKERITKPENKALLDEMGINLSVDYTTEAERLLGHRNVSSDGERSLLDTDARKYLLTSSLLSVLYMKEHFTNQYTDPALAPIRYYLGSTKLEQFTARHEGFETTLAEIEKYNMGSCRGLQYAFAFLAIQFIGQDPEAHDFTDLNAPEMSLQEAKDAKILHPVNFSPEVLLKIMP